MVQETKPGILIIDPSDQLRDELSAVLTKKKFNVSSCLDGKEALESIESNLPSLIILTPFLSRLNGFKLCQLIKYNNQWEHIPIILLHQGDALTEEMIHELKIEQVIDKPQTINPSDQSFYTLITTAVQELLGT